jgi:anthranilate phosphoribosyltransferase
MRWVILPCMKQHDAEDDGPEHPFAQYVRTLGRGPGRSRALTREEARTALRMVLQGDADPHQVGAFLMLLRYRGEDVEEIAGLVEAARAAVHAAPGPVDLDWPSYGAGRTRGAPWYLLAALALAQAGHRVLMHGSNGFTNGVPTDVGLAMLGRRPAANREDAVEQLQRRNFAYLPLTSLSPGLDRLLNLRALLGLRSPINTVARLLNPMDAPASVDGVFHPPYIALHLDTAAALGRQRLLVLKGGGGEAERNPAKPVAGHLLAAGQRQELNLPAISNAKPNGADLARVWAGDSAEAEAATVCATIALGLLAMGKAEAATADAAAAEIWAKRRPLA